MIFSEREKQIGELIEAFEAAKAGVGRVRIISGEARIGKSTLVELIQTTSNWYQTVIGFFRELAERSTPVILIIEDILWADVATLDMLKYLDRRILHSHILLILTLYDDGPGTLHSLTHLTGDLTTRFTRRITLSPLSQNAVNRRAQKAHQPPEGLFNTTGENPFFVTKMLENESGAASLSF